MENRAVQQLAKRTIAYAREVVRPGMALSVLRRLCEAHMLALGADGFWYHGIGAFVFAGDETAVSVSGAHYRTSNRRIAADDIITIDLSPEKDGLWGDYARTIVLEGGAVVEKDAVSNPEWRAGLLAEDRLHAALLECARPEITFEALHARMNARIAAEGFVNLDFHGNLGHSIVRHPDERVYIEKGNTARLDSVRLFTFEPHISRPGSKYGFKKENIYCFEDGRLRAL